MSNLYLDRDSGLKMNSEPSGILLEASLALALIVPDSLSIHHDKMLSSENVTFYCADAQASVVVFPNVPLPHFE